MSERDHLITRTIDLIASALTPVEQLRLFGRLQHRVQSAAYPRLIVQPARGNDVEGLMCPHCTVTIGNADSGFVDLTVLDIAWRTTQADSVSFTDEQVRIWYDGTGEFEGLTYTCGNCSQPVALPEGWIETAM